jgi:hypothetical protein
VPQRGEIAGRNIPPDNVYYITTFGEGPDNQTMACGAYADGTWLYIADSWRFGCGAKVKLTNPRNGRWCVTQVADVGPNICVERAAGRPIIDASPVITRELFGRSSAGVERPHRRAHRRGRAVDAAGVWLGHAAARRVDAPRRPRQRRRPTPR